nr:AraC family transcriptional regulator [Hyalangium versicolor]
MKTTAYAATAADRPLASFTIDRREPGPRDVAIDILYPAAAAPLLCAGITTYSPLRQWNVKKGETPLAVATGKASDELLDAFRRYVRLVDAPADIPVLAEAIEREILWRVMQGPHGAALRNIGLANSSLALISRAIDHLQRLQIDHGDVIVRRAGHEYP